MGVFSRLFNRKDKLSSKELGVILYSTCADFFQGMLNIIEERNAAINVKKSDVNQIEAMIVFMWAIFDAFQVDAYNDVFKQMHTEFMKHMKNLNEDEKMIWSIVQTRYAEYSAIMHSQTNLDYSKVSHKICERILELDSPNTNLLLHMMVSMYLPEFVLAVKKILDRIEFK